MSMTFARDNTTSYVMVWDLETVPDPAAFARMQGTPDLVAAEAEALMGDTFQKLPLHMIACIGALIAERAGDHWAVRALGAPHTGERTEEEIIEAFVERVGALGPKLVSFDGHGYDLPVLRYRALVNHVHAPGLSRRPYFNRYSDDAVDLCDVLSSFSPRSKVSLDTLCRFLGLAGKPKGIDGSEVADLVKEGRIQEVADYCETDVVNTYRVWLRYELFRGGLNREQFVASEDDLRRFIATKVGERPHLAGLAGA
jgi:predicted PolB exonuclease-like 3'-5' exonuclease